MISTNAKVWKKFGMKNLSEAMYVYSFYKILTQIFLITKN